MELVDVFKLLNVANCDSKYAVVSKRFNDRCRDATFKIYNELVKYNPELSQYKEYVDNLNVVDYDTWRALYNDFVLTLTKAFETNPEAYKQLIRIYRPAFDTDMSADEVWRLYGYMLTTFLR